MTDHERNLLVATLKGERMNGAKFTEAVMKADHRTLVEATEECILSHSSVVVNRNRVKFLLHTLLTRVALLPPIELAEQKAQTEQKPQKARKGGR